MTVADTAHEPQPSRSASAKSPDRKPKSTQQAEHGARGPQQDLLDYVDLILEQWSRERPDLDAAPMGTIARIWRLARLSEAATEEIFASHGLSRGGFDVLAALRRAGAPYELSPTELYSSLLISSGAMTNRIDRLEEMGLVERIPDADDRRGIKVVLTARGRKVIDEAVRDHLENERRMLDVLSPAERQVLPGLLRGLLVHLGDRVGAAAADAAAADGRHSRSR